MNAELLSAGKEGEQKVVRGRAGNEEMSWSADEILVAAGRKPNIESLGLEGVGVKTRARGIVVDDKLRTGAGWIYAAGDCAGRFLFTHSAGAEAVTALRNMFFPGSAAAPDTVPWTMFTDPELAHVGLTADEARKKLGEDGVRVHKWELGHSDRARAEASTEGRIITVTDSKFKIVGAHILAPAAGEMISQFTLALNQGLRLTRTSGIWYRCIPRSQRAFRSSLRKRRTGSFRSRSCGRCGASTGCYPEVEPNSGSAISGLHSLPPIDTMLEEAPSLYEATRKSTRARPTPSISFGTTKHKTTK